MNVKNLALLLVAAGLAACSQPTPEATVICQGVNLTAPSTTTDVIYRVTKAIQLDDPGMAAIIPANDIEVEIYGDGGALLCQGDCTTLGDFSIDLTAETDENGVLDYFLLTRNSAYPAGTNVSGTVNEIYGSANGVCTQPYTITVP